MNEETKRWWLELADQYEEWSYYVPSRPLSDLPEYTCYCLEDAFLGEREYVDDLLESGLQTVWYMAGYRGDTFPVGTLLSTTRTFNAVKNFCMDMSETIRENVGEG